MAVGKMVALVDLGTHYDNLGVVLLNGSDKSIVEAIVQDHREMAKITKEILKRWIRGKGKQPVTWKMLTDTLQTIGLTELASSIVMALSTKECLYETKLRIVDLRKGLQALHGELTQSGKLFTHEFYSIA